MSYSHRGTPAPRIQRGQQQEQPPAEAPIPETILIECARNTAPSLNQGLNSNPASWTCNFDGGIQIKKGDAISINSATLNSVGVGALINFTLDGENQNNKATWIHSFYVVNDGKNDKRSSINMDVAHNGGQGMFRYDTTNNDCDLYRFTNVGAECDDGNRTVSYYQDKFLPLRVGKTELNVNSSAQPLDIASQSMVINIVADTFAIAQPVGNATYFSVNEVAPDGTLGAIVDVRTKNVFQRGRVYRMKNASVPSMNDPDQYNDTTMNCIFGVIEVLQNTGNDRIPAPAPDGAYVKCTPIGNCVETSDVNRQIFQAKSVEFQMLSGDVNFGQYGGGDIYQYTPAFYDWEQQLFNAGDDVYTANYELLDPIQGTTPAGNKSITQFTSNGATPKGKVIQDNIYKYKIDILTMPSGGGGIYPQQGYSDNNFAFKLNGITFDSINDIVAANDNVKQFGVRIYTSTGYKYAMLWLGADGDASTITNRNRIVATNGTRGCQMFFGVNEKPTVDNIAGDVLLTDDVPVPLDSVDNPHEIIFLGRLNENISIRFYNTMKQGFQGNFVQNKNIRTGGVNVECYFLKSAITADFLPVLYNADYNNVFPVHIQNYTGGVLRGFEYFEEDDTTRVAQFANEFMYVKHYESFSYEINSKWNSPSDIATALTDQTHAPQNARTTSGDQLGNSAGLGIPHNRLCIPVFTTGGASEGDLLARNNLSEGTFKLIDPRYDNVKVNPAFVGDANPQTVSEFNVDIFFRTSQTSINYPSAITNTPRNLNYNGGAATPTNNLPPDFNQGNSLMGNTNYIRTAKSVAADGSVINYPIQYIDGQDTYISQFAGANDVSFGWDDNLSRFTIGDLHVGIYSLSQLGDTAAGGQDEVKIYVPALSYKKNQSRSGGIFIPNWYSLTPTQNMGLQSIIESLNLNYDYNFYNGTYDEENQWFLTSDNTDIIGKRFWNKLGFDDTQITQQTGSLINVSTNNEIDTAIAIVPSEEPAANRPAFSDTGNFASDNGGGSDPSAAAQQAGFEFSSFGNLNLNNHSVGMGGIPNTQGSPIQYFPNVQVSLNRTGITTLTDDEKGKFIDSEGQYNPDKERNTYYTVSTRDDMSTTLDALNLPVKTEFSYFYILSDLVESKFYSSKNGGQPINCLGTINKLNSDNDFYFSYASPQRIYATKDRVITSITTSVKNIDFSDPAIIGDFSSVVYQIDRFNPIPETIPPSVAEQQEIDFENLTLIAQEVLKSQKLPDNQTALEQVLEDLYVGGEPTENREQIVEDILEYGLEMKEEKQESAVQSITNDFLTTRRENKGKVSKREFATYLEKRRDVPEDIRDEALANWKDVEESRQGMEAVRRGGFSGFSDPDILARLRRGDIPRRGRRPAEERPVPPYILPPSFDEPNPTVEEEDEK
jgi:hypothetical protein